MPLVQRRIVSAKAMNPSPATFDMSHAFLVILAPVPDDALRLWDVWKGGMMEHSPSWLPTTRAGDVDGQRGSPGGAGGEGSVHGRHEDRSKFVFPAAMPESTSVSVWVESAGLCLVERACALLIFVQVHTVLRSGVGRYMVRASLWVVRGLAPWGLCVMLVWRGVVCEFRREGRRRLAPVPSSRCCTLLHPCNNNNRSFSCLPLFIFAA